VLRVRALERRRSNVQLDRPGRSQKESTPAAINNAGQVAGTSGQSAFRYTKTAKEQMEDVGKYSAKGIHRGFGINSSGIVVGDSSFGMNYTHAAVFMNGSAVDLGTLRQGGTFSRANAINTFGQVVGFSGEKADYMYGRAFIVSTFDRGSGMKDLGTLGGAYAQAWSINDFGFVTGNSQLNTKVEATHAFIWQKVKGMSDLGTLGGDFSYGMSINANNHVVGYSTIKENNERIHAFLHDGKQMIDLGTLGGASMESDRSFALGINANDQVVGYSYLPSQGDERLGPTPQPVQAVAFVWNGKVMLDLNGLIGDAAKNYQLDAAVAINDKGQIAAVAFDKSDGVYHAVLLTPVPRIGK
jgi:probable HAF family extracellular repeat protein